MKNIIYTISWLVLFSSITACKQNNVIPGNASLNIVDASTDVPSVAVNFVIPPISFSQQQAIVSYGAAANYGEPSGNVPLTLVSSADTSHHFYQQTLNLAAGSIHSLYVYGNLPRISTLLLQDDIPVHKDSVCGARYINLSPDAGPVNISLQGGSGNEFSSLAYKSITEFKSYSYTSSVSSNGGYNWQVTNASGNVLATFNWTPQIFQNNTLVFCGNSSAGYEVFQVNNY